MTILVTGGTGRVGSQVIAKLSGSGVAVRALTRSPEKAKFPAGVTAVKGDLLDVDSVRAALKGISTLFLLASTGTEELTQTINTLSIAREEGVRGVVYISVVKSAEYTDVPHFTSKHAVERMIEQFALPATILRPAYFFQNDVQFKDALQGGGVYPSPVGLKGISMVDVGDIAEVATIELLRRERSEQALPRKIVELSGPDALTGPALAAIWADTLGREIRYGGGDLNAFEAQIKTAAPGWMAFDLRAMFRRYQEDGAVATRADIEQLTALLGRPPRAYREFAAEAARSWSSTPKA